jgi:hypothetical protein
MVSIVSSSEYLREFMGGVERVPGKSSETMEPARKYVGHHMGMVPDS